MGQQKVDVEYFKQRFKEVGVTEEPPEELWEDLGSLMEVVTMKKSTVFDKTSYVCNKISFLHKGLIRLFYYKKEREVTEAFIRPGFAFTSMESYYQQKNSIYYVEAEEDSVYYRLSFADCEYLCNKYRAFDLFHQQLLALIMKSAKMYIDILQSETADEKYDIFCQEFAEVVLNVPSIHIASCLGITPETLSRVRARRYKS